MTALQTHGAGTQSGDLLPPTPLPFHPVAHSGDPDPARRERNRQAIAAWLTAALDRGATTGTAA